MSEIVKINLTRHEALLFEKFAQIQGVPLSKAMKDAFFEKIEKEVKSNQE